MKKLLVRTALRQENGEWLLTFIGDSNKNVYVQLHDGADAITHGVKGQFKNGEDIQNFIIEDSGHYTVLIYT